MEFSVVNKLAPIIIFAFKRPQALNRLLEDLSACDLSNKSDVFIYIDGPRDEIETQQVNNVTDVAYKVGCFKSKTIYNSEKNKGLASSIISGVTEIIELYGRVIVLEDDLHLVPNFLIYMNQMLDTYANESKVFQVSGFGLKVKRPKGYKADVYFHTRSTSWGWGTWRDRWKSIDWDVKDYDTLKHNLKQRWKFGRLGSDVYGMLKAWHDGRNNSWAIRFTYSMFKQNRLSVTPILSLTDNEGFGDNATHCKDKNPYKTEMDNGLRHNFTVPDSVKIIPSLSRQAISYFGLWSRFVNGKKFQTLKRFFMVD